MQTIVFSYVQVQGEQNTVNLRPVIPGLIQIEESEQANMQSSFLGSCYAVEFAYGLIWMETKVDVA